MLWFTDKIKKMFVRDSCKGGFVEGYYNWVRDFLEVEFSLYRFNPFVFGNILKNSVHKKSYTMYMFPFLCLLIGLLIGRVDQT